MPTAADNVTIANGHTVTIDVTAAACLSLTVGQGVSGVLQYSTATARTLTVGGNVTIAAGGTFQSATGGTVTTHALSLSGSLTNNGTLDFSTNANAAGAGITFTGATSNSFSGTGATTDIRTLTLNKGTSSANVLDLSTSAFTVQGTTTDGTPSAFLTLTNGTLKISGTFTGTHRLFSTAGYTIPASAGLWINDPSFTVAGRTARPRTTACCGSRRARSTWAPHPGTRWARARARCSRSRAGRSTSPGGCLREARSRTRRAAAR